MEKKLILLLFLILIIIIQYNILKTKKNNTKNNNKNKNKNNNKNKNKKKNKNTNNKMEIEMEIKSFYNLEKKDNNELCCLYAYYEKNYQYKDNLKYFVENGILDEIDYYFIMNGECTIDIPNKKNIKIIRRENRGFDFGAYSNVIQNHLHKEYKYYIFLNTSVRGPYLKDEYKNNNIKWYKPFLDLFKSGKDVKIVGTSINIFPFNNFGSYKLNKIHNNYSLPFSHVQSMFFIIDNEYFKYLIRKDFFNEEKLNKINNIDYLIAHYEFGLSQCALNNNWNINSILDNYKDLDYRIIKSDINPTSQSGDPYFINSYFGKTINPYDVIFFKINRF